MRSQVRLARRRGPASAWGSPFQVTAPAAHAGTSGDHAVRRTLRSFLLAMLALVLVGTLGATARMFWIPVAGPMFKKGKKVYATIKTPLVAPSGVAASGTVKLDCNAGDDADRLVVKAEGLPAGTPCQIWFADGVGKPVGDPLEAAIDADGHLRLTVFGDLCHLKQCPMLLVMVRGHEALRAELRTDSSATAVPSGAPSGATGNAAPAGTPQAAPSAEAQPSP